MTRKEQLEQQYQKSRTANGQSTARTVLRDGPRGKGSFGTVVKRTVSVGAILAALYWGVRLFVVAKPVVEEQLQSATSSDDLISRESGTRAVNGVGRVADEQLLAYLTPSEAEMIQMYGYVVQAPFVTENLQYRDRVAKADFAYIETNNVVNAFAGRRVIEENGKESLAFHTIFFGGAARYARMLGLAAAVQDAGKEGLLKKFITHIPPRLCTECSEKDAVAYLRRSGVADFLSDAAIRQRAISYSSGTIVSALAHEVGHLSLGHLLTTSGKTNLEIERNQEREADSFASSVISASPFGEYIFAGTLFWHYALAVQSDSGNGLDRNHPLSRERFENFVRANAEKAAAMGIAIK